MIDITPNDIIAKLPDEEIEFRLAYTQRSINGYVSSTYRRQLEEEYCYYFREKELRDIAKQRHSEWLEKNEAFNDSYVSYAGF